MRPASPREVDLDVPDAPEGVHDIFLQLGDEFLLRHPDRLPRYPIAVGNLLQGFRLVRQQPLMQDDSFAFGQGPGKIGESLFQEFAELAVGDLVVHALFHPVEGVDVADAPVGLIPERRVQ